MMKRILLLLGALLVSVAAHAQTTTTMNGNLVIGGLATGCIQSSSGLLTSTSTACPTTPGSAGVGQVTYWGTYPALSANANWTYSPTSGFTLIQGTNGASAIVVQRFTDSAPTGFFLNFLNAAGNTSLFTVSTAGAAAMFSLAVGSGGPLTGVQGTDVNILSAGTISASAAIPLCTDSNHGATTTGCPSASGVTDATWSAATGNNGSVLSLGVLAATILPHAHTLEYFTIAIVNFATGCSTSPVVSFYDETSSTALASLTITNGTAFFFATSSTAMTAGHEFSFRTTTAAVGCTIYPNQVNFTAVFQ
jgi:hypothetical protein